MALLVALGHFDSLVDLSIPQGPCHGRSEGARLLAGRVKRHPAVNHHAERPARHDEQYKNHPTGHPSHLFPERDRVPLRCAGLLQKPGGCGRNVSYQVCCCMSCNHELLFLLENLMALVIFKSKYKGFEVSTPNSITARVKHRKLRKIEKWDIR